MQVQYEINSDYFENNYHYTLERLSKDEDFLKWIDKTFFKDQKNLLYSGLINEKGEIKYEVLTALQLNSDKLFYLLLLCLKQKKVPIKNRKKTHLINKRKKQISTLTFLIKKLYYEFFIKSLSEDNLSELLHVIKL